MIDAASGTLPQRGILVMLGADVEGRITRHGMTIQTVGGAALRWRCVPWHPLPANGESMPPVPAWGWPDAGRNPPQRIQRVRY